MEDFRNRAIAVVRDAVDEVVYKCCLYPEKRHKALASIYPAGVKAYYDDAIVQLIKEAPNKSMTANKWVNEGMPDIGVSIVTDAILYDFENSVHLSPILNRNYQTEDEKLNYIKEEAISFFRVFYEYKRLQQASISAITQMKYTLSPQTITNIYNCCYPEIVQCNYLTFCNAIFNPDTFCNIDGGKSNLMLLVNRLAKIRSLGVKWKKDVCESKKWDVSECSRRSSKSDVVPTWFTNLHKALK
jgi:hypothetical protein